MVTLYTGLPFGKRSVKLLTPAKGWPNSNLGWHHYYVERFNKTETPAAAYLAMVYLFLHLAEQDSTEQHENQNKEQA